MSERPPAPSTAFDPQRLLEPRAYREPVLAQPIRLVETHISWVFLTGAHAFKVKKPVNLGFLDFSTLAQRHHACLEELRLNRRWAPSLYLDVVAITGTRDRPTVGGDGPVLEYAVRMRQFAANDQLDQRLDAGRLGLDDMDRLAAAIARWHDAAPLAEPWRVCGPAPLQAALHETLDTLTTAAASAALQRLGDWIAQREAQLLPLMQARRAGGCVRELHGDLHLANLLEHDDQILAFDGIEFSEELRWIDVINDLAFTTMDLQARGRADFAWRLLNRYLEHRGDYAGAALLPFCEVYRALVRAKIALLRSHQLASASPAADARRQQQHYLQLAARLARNRGGALLLMHGLSGSGKTWLSERLMSRLPAIRLRSDVERKRLHGLAPGARGDAATLYSAASSARVYARLAELAGALLDSGYTVIVDAAFLRRDDRARFRELAQRRGCPLRILACAAPAAQREARLLARSRRADDASDADLAVLRAQQRQAEALDADEAVIALTVGEGEQEDLDALLARLRRPLGAR